MYISIYIYYLSIYLMSLTHIEHISHMELTTFRNDSFTTKRVEDLNTVVS